MAVQLIAGDRDQLEYKGWKKIDFDQHLKQLGGVPGNGGGYKRVNFGRKSCQLCVFILVDEGLDQEDHRFKQALNVRNLKNRLKKILEACKNKRKCEGGCGPVVRNSQPEGMKIILEYKNTTKKSDEQEQLPEHAERKQQLPAEKVLSVLKRISDEDCQLMGFNP